MLHKISVLILLLMTVSCMKIKKKGEGEQAPAQPAEVQAQTQTQAVARPEKKKVLDFDYDFSDESQRLVFHFPVRWSERILVEKSKANQSIFQKEINSTQDWTDSFYENEKVSYKFLKL